MKYFPIVFAFLLLSCLHLSIGQWTGDYCAYSLCQGLQHIGCNNNGVYGDYCASDSQVLDIQPYQGLFADRHNRYRNAVASGNLPGFDSAVRMSTMVWDDELAYLASLNALRCVFEHDDCHNTNRFRQSGQNLAWRWDAIAPSTREAVIWAIDYWFGEYRDTSPSEIDNFYGGGAVIDHFTVMVNEWNRALGCAVLQQSDGGGFSTFATCNYATTNIIDRPVYRRGSTASQCKTGTNPSFPALCSTSERYNVNRY